MVIHHEIALLQLNNNQQYFWTLQSSEFAILHLPLDYLCQPFPSIFLIFQISIFIINRQFLMGKKIQNYVLDNIIGQGQFGKVYRAVNEKTNQTVAVKIIKIQKFKSSPKLQEFTINQIQTLSKIQDTTHIVRFIQILKTANNYYFVYQFCNGGTLQQQIKNQGRFSQQKAMNFFNDLLKAFQLLTKSNIMHRDIKPSNILLHNGIIKLADFGFCKPLKDARDLSQTMLGSPIYMAPEILKGEIYTMKADIWSLGVVLYEMLFGFCPFQEKTIARLISLIDETSIVFPSNIKISKKTEELLKKMLVKDQFKRISWQELLNYDSLIAVKEEQAPKPSMGNPFSKKTTYTSIVTQDVRNRYLNASDGYKLINNGVPLNQNMSNNSNIPPFNAEMRKKQNKSILSVSDKKILQLCIDNRSKISQGVKLLKWILSETSSKLAIGISCYLSKKIRNYTKENGENLKKLGAEKQNKQRNSEVKKLITILTDEKIKVQQKLLTIQTQNQAIKEPQQILFLKYAEEEALTQEKQGLLLLLELYDYLHEAKYSDFGRYSKKELLEEYQKRILKKL